jgi:uncharacterized protein YneF (UPF0154 family)
VVVVVRRNDGVRVDAGQRLEALEAWLGAHPDARLVVADTLARFKARASGRRSAYDEDRDAVDPLAPVAAEHGVAIVLVHHLREMESDEPLGPKDITAMLNERGQKISYGAVREMLSQMVKDGQAKYLGRGAYAHPDYRNCPDNADILTNGERNVSLSGMSGQSGKEEAERCIHDVPGGCWLCRDKGGEG